MRTCTAILILLGGVMPLPAVSAVIHEPNIALNASVTLQGDFFQGGYPDGWIVQPSTVVDGIFLDQSTYWQQGGVWWHLPTLGGQSIVIDLEASFVISALTVQVDDNDAYQLFYRNCAEDPWRLAWDIPSYNFYEGVDLFGMQNRPDPYSDSARYELPSAIRASQLMIMGTSDGDTLFSVSEVQAFGHAPEPTSLMLFGASLFSAWRVTRARPRSRMG